MSVRVRLTRVGSKKNPVWRVVVADQRSPRDGRFIETIGHYNPQTEPSTIVLDTERLEHWVARGAQATGTVKKLVKAHAKSVGEASEAEPVAAVPANAGEGEPPSAPAGEPAPSVESVVADPDEAAARRAASEGGSAEPPAGDAEARRSESPDAPEEPAS